MMKHVAALPERVRQLDRRHDGELGIALDERAHKEESLIELERLASTGGHRWRLCALVVGAVVALLVGIALVGGGGLG